MSYMIDGKRKRKFDEFIDKATKLNRKLHNCYEVGGSSFKFYQAISHRYIAKAEALI